MHAAAMVQKYYYVSIIVYTWLILCHDFAMKQLISYLTLNFTELISTIIIMLLGK